MTSQVLVTMQAAPGVAGIRPGPGSWQERKLRGE